MCKYTSLVYAIPQTEELVPWNDASPSGGIRYQDTKTLERSVITGYL
jgi:hypothetical protein